MRDALDQIALGAVADDDDWAVLAAFERAFQAGEHDSVAGFFVPVASDASRVKNRLDVGRKSHAGFRRGRRQCRSGGRRVLAQTGCGKTKNGGKQGDINFFHGYY